MEKLIFKSIVILMFRLLALLPGNLVIVRGNWNIYEDLHSLPFHHGRIERFPRHSHHQLAKVTRNATSKPTTTGKPIYEIDPNPAVQRFREYLRLDSSHPNPNYEPCILWLKGQAEEIGLEFHRVDFPPPGLFTIRLTWPGTQPKLKSIILNSHIDVVPADKSKWIHDPFAAVKDSNGNIYGRGAQDRKSLGVQYLEAIRGLKAKGYRPLRTVHITFVPDEELGGGRGMALFVASDDFKSLNVGVEMDEGGATMGDEFALFYGERSTWQFRVTATGRTSHAALMLQDNSAVKLGKVISRFLEFREEQRLKLIADPNLVDGDVTSINLSQLGGGVQPNTVPSELWAIFDMRIRLRADFTFDDAEKMIQNIVTDAGPGVRVEFILKSKLFRETNLDATNIWWTTFKGLFDEMGLTLAPKYFPGATDARYLRNAGFPAFGFSPLPRTQPLQHQDNEYLNETTFLNGIRMYELIIPRMTSVDSSFG